jgi:probable O-glycosylation ligase (exosortase A-associated)
MFSSWQKTCLLYVVGVILIDNARKLKAMSAVIIVTVAYLVYWANAQYFLYGKFGRLHGPMDLFGGGIYADENNFAVLFVVGTPFLLYFGLYLKRRMLSWMTWALIPFAWHAVFLTASRGALVAIAAVLVVFVIRLKNRAAGALVIAAFLGAFAWQAGEVMKSRSATISEYENEDSAASRIKAWEASIGMMAAHPITGVGFASFGQAFPDFSDIPPRIAHNTYFQIGGEWGVVAGAAYLVLIFSTLNRLRKNGNRLRKSMSTEVEKLYYYMNEACLLGLLGFFVCACFLSLQQYEVLYLLLLLSNGTLVFSKKPTKDVTAKEEETVGRNNRNASRQSLGATRSAEERG